MNTTAAQVAEQVRARAHVDDANNIRHIVEDVIAEHSAGVSSSEIVRMLTGLGPLQPLMEDPLVEEIWINAPSRVFAAKNGKPELTSVILDDQQVAVLVERMLGPTGRRVDVSSPFVDAMLPDGSRLHVAIPDITRKHWAVNIRKFVMGSRSLNDLMAVGTIPTDVAQYLSRAVSQGKNIIVSGATQAGKTTLMNALLNSATATDRIVTCEEVFELQLASPDWVALQTRQAGLEGTGEISLRRLIKEALRMRPSRLVVGEVRQEECLDLLVAMNAGMPSMCSVHANSARDALTKLSLLPMLAGSNVSADFVVPTVASVVDVVVQVSLCSDGVRRVIQVFEVPGRVEGHTIEMHEVFSDERASLRGVA